MAAGLALALWLQVQARRPPPGPGRTPPFSVRPLEVERWDGASALLALPGPGVVLYVDDACRFCAEELRRWHAATEGVAPAWLTVIRHPGDGVPHPGVVPTDWARATLVDRTGAVAAQLGVTGVPFLARTDSVGAVVEVTLGVTSPERIHSLLQTLGTDPGKGTSP